MSKMSSASAWPQVAPLTTIVVPTYNEADNVLPLVERVRRALNGHPAEILFVDDSHNLDTIKAIDLAGGLYGTASFHVKSYHRTGAKRQGGLSGAVVDGIRYATANQIIIMDGDLQHPPETIPSLLAAGQDHDVVVASRYCQGGKADGLDGGIRHLVSRGSTILAKTFFPKRLSRVTDPMTGFFLVNRRAIDLDKLHPKGFKILLEILARHANLRVSEVPFVFAERLAGESKGTIKQGLQYFGQLATIKQTNTVDAFCALPKLVQFGLIGGGVFGLGMVLLYTLVDIFGWTPLQANALQLGVTFGLNYLLNRHLTWRDRDISQAAAVKFVVSRAATTVLNYYLFAWLIALNTVLTVAGQSFTLSIHYLLANVISLAVIMGLNYIISDLWAFADADSTKQRRQKRRAKTGTAPSTRRSIISAVLWASLAGSIIAWGIMSNANLTVSVLLAIAGLVMFVQSSVEVWRVLYAFREPEAVDRLRFPAAGTPQEKFCLIVPARHEDAVLAYTLRQLAQQTHPDVTIVTVICDDDLDTLQVARQAAAENQRVELIVYPLGGAKPNKPSQMNYVMSQIADRGYTVIGVIDAEDSVQPELLMHVDAAFADKTIDVVQGGVQLMNHDSSWYSLHNVLEYYKWFSSAFAFHADKEFFPLGGNTVFIRHDLLQKAGGWPTTLTEDCSLGVLLSTEYNAKTAVYYEPRLATQEETPDSLKGLFKQRVRWNQGFYHEWRKGVWRNLPRLSQRLLAAYVLLSPVMLAWSSLMMFAAIFAATLLDAPVGLVLLMYVSLVPMFLLMILNIIFLHDFGKAFGRRIKARSYVILLATGFLYQIVLNAAALWSIIRELRGDQSWHKTAHTGLHRQQAFATADASVMAGNQETRI